ncbi:flagellar basal body rod modification protein FlgD [Legionella norrlandica]|uniref:Basal-body rod modification protein FlgD n=1 Tax=Legionella norrlandica TaxID=1498499 RepID=A0A0A2T605_9GAMM|nr:flagellar hook assembly protein FlgD [Legionella norrlandica]KGP62858.1 flagellar basal body rod modification protein FlgD [Legionella norrlandica]
MVANSTNDFSPTSDLVENPTNPEKRQNLGQQDFLRLMVEQIRNQGSLQRHTHSEFLSQLTQGSAKEGIIKMQESLQQLVSSLQSNQALQASALVGRKVLVNSDVFYLGAEGETKATIEMVLGVANLNAFIYTQAGELIKAIPLSQPTSGLFQWSWDGTNQSNQRMEAGKYIIKVSGTYDGEEVALKTMISTNVDSVKLGQHGEDLKLNVAGIGSIYLNQVMQIFV